MREHVDPLVPNELAFGVMCAFIIGDETGAIHYFDAFHVIVGIMISYS